MSLYSRILVSSRCSSRFTSDPVNCMQITASRTAAGTGCPVRGGKPPAEGDKKASRGRGLTVPRPGGRRAERSPGSARASQQSGGCQTSLQSQGRSQVKPGVWLSEVHDRLRHSRNVPQAGARVESWSLNAAPKWRGEASSGDSRSSFSPTSFSRPSDPRLHSYTTSAPVSSTGSQTPAGGLHPGSSYCGFSGVCVVSDLLVAIKIN